MKYKRGSRGVDKEGYSGWWISVQRHSNSKEQVIFVRDGENITQAFQRRISSDNKSINKYGMNTDLISSESSERYNSGYGAVDTRTQKLRATDKELDEEREERREDQRILQELEERRKQIEKSKEEANNARKQNEKLRKPRRKAIGKYNPGDTIEKDGRKYNVIGSDDGKTPGWYVWDDENGKMRFIDKFGNMKD